MSISLLLICLLLWALVIVVLLAVEHGYLSSTPARWLYDLCAPFYQGKWKRNSEEYSAATTDRLFLSPVLEAVNRTGQQQVLDLGCGTGRLSLALARDARFQGTIQACDFSPQMLKIFRGELAALDATSRARIHLQEGNLESWQHQPGILVGAVFLVEAGEFVTHIRQLLQEISRALPSDGILVMTKPYDWYARLLVGRPLTRAALSATLTTIGFDDISFHTWSSRHEVVWAKRR